MGCDFALDLASGKMRWRNGRFYDIAQRIRQNNAWVGADHFLLNVVDGERAVGRRATGAQGPQQ